MPARFIVCLAAVVLFAGSVPLSAQDLPFVNWENPPVHPLDRTPDGTRLLATNLADGRLEVFTIEADGSLTAELSIPVGVDPVSVRARTDSEAWVVNHISDSVNVVDLDTGTVVATIRTLDEPCDVVFAGDPERAFVSCSAANTIQVFDPADLTAAPDAVELFAEDPRALAVSTDGGTVYAAVFESGNASTSLGGIDVTGDADGFPPDVVSHPDGPYGGVNPPPNDGDEFSPAQNPVNPVPLPSGMIVKKNALGEWLDGSGEDWTDFVTGPDAEESGRPIGWDLPDYDLAIIDADTLVLDYASGLMNSCMAVGVNPSTDSVCVIGTDGTNEVRFEPNLNGVFHRVVAAFVDPTGAVAPELHDLNPHLDYTSASVVQSERDRSIGDPRAVVWTSDGETAYVCGKGSNNVIQLTSAGARGGVADTIEVGEGPSGLILDEEAERLYVLNHFAGSISIVDTATESEIEQVSYFDPTPLEIRVGRKHLYDTHKNSGLGHVACASCHIDSRIDRLAWDLGDPAGEMKIFDQNCIDLPTADCDDFHPMKGPMLTQTLQDIIGKEPLHWRGDRDGIEEFNGAFEGLQGDDESLTDEEMQEFEDFLATIHFPPNPFRNLDNSLPTDLPLPGHYTTGRFAPAGAPLPNGNAVSGLADYRGAGLDTVGGGLIGIECVTCHTMPTGLGRDTVLITTVIPTPPFIELELVPFGAGPNGESHLGVTTLDVSTGEAIKVPHLRNLYDRTGFNTTQLLNTAGFGYLHDGSVDSIERFLNEPVFGFTSDQQTANMVAFMLAFSGSDLPEGDNDDPTEPLGVPSLDSHAAVGAQLSFDGTNNTDADLIALYDELVAIAASGEVGLVVKGLVDDELRGYYLLDATTFQSDRATETVTVDSIRLDATADSVRTITAVPYGARVRLGVDRDEDGFLDTDELDACSDPADAASVPGAGCGESEFERNDCNTDGSRDLSDAIRLLDTIFQAGPAFACDDACDSNDDGALDLVDAITILDYLFQGGAAPAAPFSCGSDPTPDALTCDDAPACP